MSDTSISASRTIDASPADLFAVLADPGRHADLDGSGFIRSDESNDQLTGVGQVFTMNMEGEHMGGAYQTENHVVTFEQDRRLAWKTAPKGVEPPGWVWDWQLSPAGNGTDVTVTYDWSGVTDPGLLEKVPFPLVPVSGLEASLDKLAAAV